MDIVLDICDEHIFNSLYQHSFFPTSFHHADYLPRQFISLYAITNISAFVLYLSVASINYFLFFDKSLEQHPKFLKNQISREIKYALWSMPVMGFMTVLCFLAEVRGYSALYRDPLERGAGYLVLSVFTFLFFTDMLIYW
jgi:lathosterol oxidase